MFDPAEIIRVLNSEKVDYIVIGGFAATLYGCPEQTFDLDVLYEDSEENRIRLASALRKIDAQWDEPITPKTLTRQPLFALNSPFGDLDIFRTIPGADSFSALRSGVQSFKVKGESVPVLSLAALIETKEAAADSNPRKKSALVYLKALQQHRDAT